MSSDPEYIFRKTIEWASISLFPLILFYWVLRKKNQKVVRQAQKKLHTILIRTALSILFLLIIFSLVFDFGHCDWKKITGSQEGYLAIVYTGIAVAFMGSLLMGWSLCYLGETWTMTTSVLENHQLVTDGPYRFCRHPMYTSTYIYSIGIFLLSGYWTIEIGLLLMVTASALRIRDEERQLVRQFGNKYVDYLHNVMPFCPIPFFNCGVDIDQEQATLLSEFQLANSANDAVPTNGSAPKEDNINNDNTNNQINVNVEIQNL